MEGVKFFEGQNVLLDDMEALQSALEDQIADRTRYIFTPGIVVGISGYDTDPYVVLGTATNSIKVLKFIAYDSNGELVKVASDLDNLKPDGTGALVSVGGSWSVSETYSIVARYVEIDDTQAEHPETHVLYDTRKHDSYTLHAITTTPLTADIVLAQVVTDSGGVPVITTEGYTAYLRLEDTKVNITVTGSSASPSTYTEGEIKTLADHINAVGTGTLSPTNPHALTAEDLGIAIQDVATHQKILHTAGMYSDAPSATTSALYPTVVVATETNSDYISFAPLLLSLNEQIVVNGLVVNSVDIPATLTFTFLTGGSVPITAGYYLFVVNSATKTIEMKGPYTNDKTDAALLVDLANPAYYPIWSIRWYANPTLSNPDNYNLDQATLKDWRVFGNTSHRNVDHSLLGGSINMGASIGNRSIKMYTARILGLTDASFFNVSGLTFIANPNGTGNRTVTFSGTDPISAESVVLQLNAGITNTFLASTTLDRNIKLLSSDSLVLGSGTANGTLGFIDSDYDTDLNIKEMIATGEIAGSGEISYSGSEVSSVTYNFGGKALKQEFSYSSNGNILEVTETIGYPGT